MRKSWKKEEAWRVLVIWIFLFLLFLCCSSCRTQYVPVPEYHSIIVEKHDTLLKTDSIFEKDSVWVKTSGDTIITYRERIIYKDRWREKIVYKDSLKSDSIRVPYPVEKPLGFWQKSWIQAGKISIIVYFVFFAITFFRKWLLARSKCFKGFN